MPSVPFHPEQSPLNLLVGSDPVLWSVTFDIERFWQSPNPSHVLGPSLLGASDAATVAAMEENVLCISRPQDLVLVRQRPDDALIEYLSSLGLGQGTVIEVGNDPGTWSQSIAHLVLQDPILLGRVRNHVSASGHIRIMTYGTTRHEEALAAGLKIDLATSSAAVAEKVNSKAFSRSLNNEQIFNVIPGTVILHSDQFIPAFRDLHGDRCRPVFVKDPMGVNGKGLKLLSNEGEAEILYGYFQRRGIESLCLVLETQLPKKTDLNSQVVVTKQGDVYPIGCKEAITDNGRHLGHITDKTQRQPFLSPITRAAQYLGQQLAAAGFYGVAGHDVIVTEDDSVYPNVEINARLNQSSFQWALDASDLDCKCFWFGHIDWPKKEITSFSNILKALKPDLLFTAESCRGVMPINYATLRNFKCAPGPKIPRLYCAIFAENRSECMRIYSEAGDRLARA